MKGIKLRFNIRIIYFVIILLYIIVVLYDIIVLDELKQLFIRDMYGSLTIFSLVWFVGGFFYISSITISNKYLIVKYSIGIFRNKKIPIRDVTKIKFIPRYRSMEITVVYVKNNQVAAFELKTIGLRRKTVVKFKERLQNIHPNIDVEFKKSLLW